MTRKPKTEVRLTANEKHVLALIEQAEDGGYPIILGIGKTAWYGDLWVNHLTAKSLQRKGYVRIDWSQYSDDDHYVYRIGGTYDEAEG